MSMKWTVSGVKQEAEPEREEGWVKRENTRGEGIIMRFC